MVAYTLLAEDNRAIELRISKNYVDHTTRCIIDDPDKIFDEQFEAFRQYLEDMVVQIRIFIQVHSNYINGEEEVAY